MNRGFVTTLKDDKWLCKQKIAGKCVNTILSQCEYLIKSGQKVNLLDLQALAELQFKAFDCTATFFNYKGFPSKICVAVNKQMVHGIVNDYYLQVNFKPSK